jgi:hypothetical protein
VTTTPTSIGAGIEPVSMPTVVSDVTPVPMPVVESPSQTPPVEMPTATPFEIPSVPGGFDIMGLVESIKAGLRHEMDAAVADIERRLGQAREIERAIATGVPRETIHAEDLNLGFAMIDGYTLTANSPSNGSIAWSNLHVVLEGIDYTINAGNTAQKYVWFIKPASYIVGTDTVTLLTGPTIPTLGPKDALIFINNVSGGMSTPVSVLESTVVYAVGAGAIGTAQLDTSTQTLLTNLQSSDLALQAQLDGTINSYYQANAPWADGSPSPDGGNKNQGDVWYDSDNGWTYRWTGSTGSPANTWFRIADTDIALIAGKVNVKTTTYVANLASPPTAPSGGFTTGDFWMVTDQGNLIKRWNGTAWADLQMGNAAISDVSGGKVGAGILPSNLTGAGTAPVNAIPTLDLTTKTSGNLGGARVGAGVAPSVLTGAGTAPVAAIPSLTPAKLNTAFHMLY